MKLHGGDISYSPYKYKTEMVVDLFESTVKLKKRKIRKTQKYSFSKCLLSLYVVRVFVSFCVLVFVWAILSWCP